jgi:phospholipase C
VPVNPQSDDTVDPSASPHKTKPLSPPGRGLLGLLLAKYGGDGHAEPETFEQAYTLLRRHGLGLFYPKIR